MNTPTNTTDNPTTPPRRKRKPRLLSKTEQFSLADYVTDEDIHNAVEILRRQLKRKSARAARYLLEKALYR
jgi:hypothetical protein